jgi:hypothetical protein
MKPLSDRLRVLLVHGMASKPAEQAWLDLWRTCLLENLDLEARGLGRRLAEDEALLVSTYWADAVPDHLPETPERVRGLRRSVAALIDVRRQHRGAFHIPKTGWGDAQLRRFGPAILDALTDSLGIEPALRESHRWELNRYHTDSVVAERIRGPLADRLRENWDAGRRVIVIAHSLGAAVAYDVLWRFCHRTEPEFRTYRKHAVDLLITMGAPLADPEAHEIMLSGRWFAQRRSPRKSQRCRAWLGNVLGWHNYSALGDLVCHGLDMQAEFFAGMCADLDGRRPGDFRDYRRLFNPYRDPDGVANPHKAFGYIVQPKLAQQLIRQFRAAGLP